MQCHIKEDVLQDYERGKSPVIFQPLHESLYKWWKCSWPSDQLAVNMRASQTFSATWLSRICIRCERKARHSAFTLLNPRLPFYLCSKSIFLKGLRAGNYCLYALLVGFPEAACGSLWETQYWTNLDTGGIS